MLVQGRCKVRQERTQALAGLTEAARQDLADFQKEPDPPRLKLPGRRFVGSKE